MNTLEATPVATATLGAALPIKDLKAIAATLRAGNPEPATNEIWNDAALTGTFSLSSGGGNLEGWISLYDGTKVNFEMVSITSRTGTAAGTFAVPLVRVRPIVSGEIGTFELGGFWAVGELKLSPVSGSIPMISAAPLNYYLAGTVKLTKA